jgi:hypothetical protein
MNELTPEQIAIVEPVSIELADRFFDIVGRLDEKDYFGEFTFEAFKAALFLNRDHKVPQLLAYKYIRQQNLSLSDMVVVEEYNVMHKAVIFGMHLVQESLRKPASN